MDNNQELAGYSQAERRRLMHGDWTGPTEEELELSKIAAEYHTRCDAYDRKVCSGISPITGEPMPIGDEFRLVNRHAREVIGELVAKNPYSREQIWKAIQKYSRQGGHQ
jgi:hypothetical protein